MNNNKDNVFCFVSKKNEKNKKETNMINKNLVSQLEDILKLAKKGEIVAFAGVSLSSQETMRHYYSGDIDGNYLSFQGMLNDLSSEIKQNYED